MYFHNLFRTFFQNSIILITFWITLSCNVANENMLYIRKFPLWLKSKNLQKNSVIFRLPIETFRQKNKANTL